MVEVEGDVGKEHVKRGLEIATAGAHSGLMSGPPGSGKTKLARALPSILPAITVPESLEVMRIHSVRGLLPRETTPMRERPFRAPHHTTGYVGLVGEGGDQEGRTPRHLAFVTGANNAFEVSSVGVGPKARTGTTFRSNQKQRAESIKTSESTEHN